MKSRSFLALTLLGIAGVAFGSADSIGPNGINSRGLRDFNGDLLQGGGSRIGQVEALRTGLSGYDTNTDCCEPSTIPSAVFYRDAPANPNEGLTVTFHPMWVAGVLISTDPLAQGVAVDAELYAAAFDEDNSAQPEFAITAQNLALGEEVDAINLSVGQLRESDPLVPLNGNSLLTSFIDWSASQHNVLYVVAGNQVGQDLPVPTDEFNGLTVAASVKDGTDGVFRRVAVFE